MANATMTGMAGLALAAMLGVSADALLDRMRIADGSSRAAASDDSNFFIATDPVVCGLVSASECRASVLVRATKPGTAALRAELGSGTQRVPLTVQVGDTAASTFAAPAAGAFPVQVVLKGQSRLLEFVLREGFIGTGSGIGFDSTPRILRLVPTSPSNWEPRLLLLPGLLALSITFVAGLVAAAGLKDSGGLFSRMGGTTWRASDSWSANITVGASFVNALLAVGVFKDQTHYMSSKTYTLIVVLFNSILALAPVVYSLFTERVRNLPERPLTTAGIPLPQPVVETTEGFVVTYLAAGWLTLWASLGQLFTFGMLDLELMRMGLLTRVSAYTIAVLLGAVVAGLSVYAGVAMAKTPLLAKREAEPRDAAVEKSEPHVAARAANWALL